MRDDRKSKNFRDFILICFVLILFLLCAQLGFVKSLVFKAMPNVVESFGIPNLPDKLAEKYAVDGELKLGCTYIIYPKSGIPTNYKNLGMQISGTNDIELALTSGGDALLNSKNDPLYNGYKYVFFESVSGKVWVLRPKNFQAHPENFVCSK